MLHIFLTIVKIPFLLLAVLLLLLLILLLTVLFVPIRYRARIEKEDSLAVDAGVHWLFHALSLRLLLREGKPQIVVRVFGYPIVGGREKSGQEKDEALQSAAEAEEEPTQPQSTAKAEAEKEPTLPQDTAKAEAKEVAPMPQNTVKAEAEEEPTQPQDTAKAEAEEEPTQPQDTAKAEAKEVVPMPQNTVKAEAKEAAPIPQGTVKAEAEKEPTPRAPRKKQNPFRKVQNLVSRIRDSLLRMRDRAVSLKNRAQSYLDLWNDEHTQGCIAHLKKELVYLLRHYLPKKPQGRLLFGLKDPALTGQLLGLLYILQVFAGSQLAIEADFEEPVLETDLHIKGRIRICHAAKSALSLLLDRHCRVTLARVRSLGT